MGKWVFATWAILLSIKSLAGTTSVPEWSKGLVWYQIFPERFRNGNISNDVGGEFSSWIFRAMPELRGYQLPLTSWTTDWFQYGPEEEILRKNFRAKLTPLNNAFNESFGSKSVLFPRNMDLEVYLARRYGGDLEGIRQAIPYLQKLGIGGVYLNPVFLSPSLHKYDTADYRHIDPYFGPMVKNVSPPQIHSRDQDILAGRNLSDPSKWEYTSADLDFMKLVNEFHKAGIRVVIDGVFNHTALSGVFTTDIAIKGPDSKYLDWIAASYRANENWSPAEKQFYPCSLSDGFADANLYPYAAKIRYRGWMGNVCSMPEFKKDQAWDGKLHPEYQKFVFNIMERWLKPRQVGGQILGVPTTFSYSGVDGVRLDVYREIPEEYWRKFRSVVKSIRSDVLIVAEEWGDGFDILTGDSADSLMNYSVRTVAESWMIDNTGPGDERKYFPSWLKGFVDFRQQRNRPEVIHSLWSMFDSHDTDRIYSKTIMNNRLLLPPPRVIGQHTLWDEADINRPHQTNASYDTGRPGVEDREFYKSLVAFQMVYSGAPVVYYGAEVGMWGADDPTNRKPMLWSDLSYADETKCTTAYQDLSSLSGGQEFCLRNFDVKYPVAPDNEIFQFYKKMISLRNSNPAIKKGSLSMNFAVEVDGVAFDLGDPNFDRKFLWGFERSLDNHHVYLVSNQDLTKPFQQVKIYTKFQPGTVVKEAVSGSSFSVNQRGAIEFSLARDRVMVFHQ